MTILGHDVNGRPLRAGDRVVFVGRSDTFPDAGKWSLRIVRIDPAPCPRVRAEHIRQGGVILEVDSEQCGLASVLAHRLRRLDDRTDHQPSEYTFDSLMDQLKSGVPA